MTSLKNMNPDLLKERENSTLDVEDLKNYLGELMYKSLDNYKMMTQLRNLILDQIKLLYINTLIN
jgi:hypothetical protein